MENPEGQPPPHALPPPELSRRLQHMKPKDVDRLFCAIQKKGAREEKRRVAERIRKAKANPVRNQQREAFRTLVGAVACSLLDIFQDGWVPRHLILFSTQTV